MEHSLSTLTFKGSITNAIAEAKQQKKLFLVYISGDNQESDDLATSTWTDSTLAESILKFCIFLHISEGTPDAANFSAIYPQKSPPCITAIGYNGMLLWQYDGFISADMLVSSIEKSWLSLHIQETTATYLTAALASKKQPTSESSGAIFDEQGSSSGANVISSSRNLPEVETSENHEIFEETSWSQPAFTDEKCDAHDTAIDESSLVDEIGNYAHSDDACPSRTAEATVTPGTKGLSMTEDRSLTPEEIVNNTHLKAMGEDPIEVAKEDVKVQRDEDGEVKNINVQEPSASESNEVHLNIRLPDGSSLHVRFTLIDSLRMVKDYVDANQTITFGPYHLAIPYPRKVFGEEDLSKTLQELDLFGRQTLIVVQHRHSTPPAKAGSSLQGESKHDGNGSSNGNNDGYWGYVRGVLSFFNPFSYLSGGANSSDSIQESQNNTGQYRTNHTLQNNLRAAGRSYGANSSNQSTTTSSRSSGRALSRPPFGSNIHTLKHDEDDNRSADRNTFWNGNSTQFGGNSDDK